MKSRFLLVIASRFLAGAALSVATAGAAHAQTTGNVQCPSPVVALSGTSGSAQSANEPIDVCQKASDLFSFVSPQLGIALAGGNLMLGEGGTLGGWGKRSASIRISAVDGQLPRNSVPLTSTGTAVSSDFGAQRTILPVPTFTTAIGLIRGIPVGLSNVGGVDLLLGATYVPTVNRQPLSLQTENGGFAFGYGLRAGVLQESSIVPGLSLSYMRRKLPRTDFNFTPDNDTLVATDASVRSESWRVTASKRFVFFAVAAGVGRDMIQATSAFDITINETLNNQPNRLDITIPVATERVSRNTAFVNVALGLPRFQVVGEFGWSSQGTLRETVNTFGDHKANEGYRYGSLGLGFRY